MAVISFALPSQINICVDTDTVVTPCRLESEKNRWICFGTNKLYQLWFPLLDFVNRKYHVCPETETIDQRQGVDACDAKAIADYLWSHTEVIEEYLAVAELPNEYAQIVAGWKQCKPGRYILERHLKKGSVFISAD